MDYALEGRARVGLWGGHLAVVNEGVGCGVVSGDSDCYDLVEALLLVDNGAYRASSLERSHIALDVLS